MITWCKIQRYVWVKHLQPCRQPFIDFHEIRSPFSAFCHDFNTHEVKWRWWQNLESRREKISTENVNFSAKDQNTLTQAINSIYTSCIQEPEEIPPYVSHTALLKHGSTIYRIHNPALNYGLGFWVRLPFPWWTMVSFWWWEQAQPEKPIDSFNTSEMKWFQQRHKQGSSPQKLNSLPRI